jgi:hypothetical protein
VSASRLMVVAILLYVVHRWATGKTAVDVQVVVGGLFAILVIAMLDQGETEPVAKGFAWLFVLVAAYNAIPAISKVSSGKAAAPAPKKAGA